MADSLTDLSLLKGRKVLVTGSTGFKGSWIGHWLLALGADVAGFALPPEEDAPLFSDLRLHERIKQTYGDIRNFEVLRDAIKAFEPEIVIHLAAQALVLRGYENPKLTFDVNVGGGTNLCDAIRAMPSVRSFVFITSDKCYLNKEWVWAYRENDELGGSDPYSGSKAAAELMFASYQKSYFSRNGIAAATARAGNVVGGGDRSVNRIVPDCIRALQSGSGITLRNPSAVRPWQHVLEPVSGYLLLAARLLEQGNGFRGAWNFAPNVENIRTVREVAHQIAVAWGSPSAIIETENAKHEEAQLLMLANEKAKMLLGWRPRLSFSETMEWTVEWYKSVAQGCSAAQITDRQIAAYLGKAA